MQHVRWGCGHKILNLYGSIPRSLLRGRLFKVGCLTHNQNFHKTEIARCRISRAKRHSAFHHGFCLPSTSGWLEIPLERYPKWFIAFILKKTIHARTTTFDAKHFVNLSERDEARQSAGEHSAAHERGGFLVIDRETGLESSVSAFAGKALDYMATQAEGLIEGIASLFDGGSAAPREAPPLRRRPQKSALQGSSQNLPKILR